MRKICPRCKEAYDPTEEQLMELQLTPDDLKGRQVYRGNGCDFCNQSGYKGRMALFEIMVLDDDMRELIMHNASTQVLRAEALKRGMRTLRHSGLLAIFDGRDEHRRSGARNHHGGMTACPVPGSGAPRDAAADKILDGKTLEVRLGKPPLRAVFAPLNAKVPTQECVMPTCPI